MKLRFFICVIYCVVFCGLLMSGMNRWMETYSQFGTMQREVATQSRSERIAKWTTSRKPKFVPTSAYQQKFIQGFTVLIHPTVLKHRQDAKIIQQELDSQLGAIVRIVPAQALSVLKEVRIWVEWENGAGAAEFHPSAEWLRQNGKNPDKADCIEVSNTRNFIQWSRTDQPWMILHELAHGYHHLILGDTNTDIRRACQNAIDQALYQAVAYIKGGKQKAYALVNEKEYFAELSEAYFGKNDFYPFTHADLKAYDRMGYQLMKKFWDQL
jgi:hypothetical protein